MYFSYKANDTLESTVYWKVGEPLLVPNVPLKNVWADGEEAVFLLHLMKKNALEEQG